MHIGCIWIQPTHHSDLCSPLLCPQCYPRCFIFSLYPPIIYTFWNHSVLVVRAWVWDHEPSRPSSLYKMNSSSLSSHKSPIVPQLGGGTSWASSLSMLGLWMASSCACLEHAVLGIVEFRCITALPCPTNTVWLQKPTPLLQKALSSLSTSFLLTLSLEVQMSWSELKLTISAR